MSKFNLKKGFTLIELVVVIAVLGILAGIAIPRFMDASATARGSRIVADMRMLESALSLYLVKNELKANVDAGNTILKLDVLKNDGYIAAIPKPSSGDTLFPNGRRYTLPSTGCEYQIYRHARTGQYGIELNVNGIEIFIDQLVGKTVSQ